MRNVCDNLSKTGFRESQRMDVEIAEGKVFTQWSAGWQGFDMNIECHHNLALKMCSLSLGL